MSSIAYFLLGIVVGAFIAIIAFVEAVLHPW